jgi:hypothetical protein
MLIALVHNRDAEAYLPTRKEPLKVTLGVKEQQTTTVPTFGSIKLG